MRYVAYGECASQMNESSIVRLSLVSVPLRASLGSASLRPVTPSGQGSGVGSVVRVEPGARLAPERSRLDQFEEPGRHGNADRLADRLGHVEANVVEQGDR